MHIANNIVIAFCLHAPSLSPPSTFANGAFLPSIRGEIMVNYSALPAASLAIISDLSFNGSWLATLPTLQLFALPIPSSRRRLRFSIAVITARRSAC